MAKRPVEGIVDSTGAGRVISRLRRFDVQLAGAAGSRRMRNQILLKRGNPFLAGRAGFLFVGLP
jgi:hypothetical protein